jgi:Ca-activated chloride channel homolog
MGIYFISSGNFNFKYNFGDGTMNFELSSFKSLFFILPLVIAVMWAGRAIRKRRRYRFVSPVVFKKLAPTLSLTRRFWKKGILLCSLFLFVIAIMRPQYGVTLEATERKGLNIFIAIDTSASMEARDIKPSRLDHAKTEVLGLIENLKGDRIGLIAFSGDASIQCPLTLDYSAAKLFLGDINSGLISAPGTDIATAIKVARMSFQTQKNNASNVLVIISDGESFENDPVESAKVAAENNMNIYTIGIGTTTGEPIPLYNKQGKQEGFKKDKNGSVVVSRLNQTMLKNISDAANGKYVLSSNAKFAMDEVYREISRLEKDSMESQLERTFIDRYHWILFPLFLLLITEFCLSERRRSQKEWKGRL